MITPRGNGHAQPFGLQKTRVPYPDSYKTNIANRLY
jgi:hypothetical protein